MYAVGVYGCEKKTSLWLPAITSLLSQEISACGEGMPADVLYTYASVSAPGEGLTLQIIEDSEYGGHQECGCAPDTNLRREPLNVHGVYAYNCVAGEPK